MADESSEMSCLQVVHNFLELSSPRAVDETVIVDLDGCPHVVSIRGADRRNPVILFVHGGPGTPLAATAWMWQRPLEDFFTVVHYDQRGAGRSYQHADRQLCAPP